MSKKSGRKHERINLSRMAWVSFPGRQRHIYSTQDISLTGMFITGQFEYPLGALCAITLTERWSGQVFVMDFTGEVARRCQDGLAIKFTEMALKPYTLLQTVLLYGSHDPMLFGQEFAKGYPFKISEYRQRTASNNLRDRPFFGGKHEPTIHI